MIKKLLMSLQFETSFSFNNYERGSAIILYTFCMCTKHYILYIRNVCYNSLHDFWDASDS